MNRIAIITTINIIAIITTINRLAAGEETQIAMSWQPAATRAATPQLRDSIGESLWIIATISS